MVCCGSRRAFRSIPGSATTCRLDPSRLPSSGAAARLAQSDHRDIGGATRAREERATTRVVAVFPGADDVPENQLGLYISFSAPMSLGGGSGYVQLARRTRARGRRSLSSAGRRSLERRSDAVHGLVRSRARQTRDPAERRDGTGARPPAVDIRWSSTMAGVTRRDSRWSHRSATSFRAGPSEDRAIDPQSGESTHRAAGRAIRWWSRFRGHSITACSSAR